MKQPALCDVFVSISAVFAPLQILFVNQHLYAALDGGDERREATTSLTDYLTYRHHNWQCSFTHAHAPVRTHTHVNARTHSTSGILHRGQWTDDKNIQPNKITAQHYYTNAVITIAIRLYHTTTIRLWRIARLLPIQRKQKMNMSIFRQSHIVVVSSM